MIKGHIIRPDAACHSADVLTPVEHAVERMRSAGFVDPRSLTYRDGFCKWADIPHIRDQLSKLKGAS